MKKKEDEYVRFTLLAANKPESSNYKMKRFFPPSVNVPVEDIIFDEKTGSQRKIRYIPGEKSIFADEQSIKEMPKKRSEIMLYDGWKTVSTKETTLLAYLRACNYNAGAKNRMKEVTPIFKEFKPEANAQAALDKEMVDLKAKNAAMNMKFEEMMVFAKAIGLNTDRESAEIRHDLVMRAKSNPGKFLNDLENKNTKVKWAVLEAADAGIISVNKQNATISWVNGGVIFQTSVASDVVEDFSEHLQETEDGKKLFEKIKRMYEKARTANDPLDDEQIAEKAIQAAIIIKKGPWFYYGDQKLYQSLGMVTNWLKENPLVKEELKQKIANFEKQSA